MDVIHIFLKEMEKSFVSILAELHMNQKSASLQVALCTKCLKRFQGPCHFFQALRMMAVPVLVNYSLFSVLLKWRVAPVPFSCFNELKKKKREWEILPSWVRNKKNCLVLWRMNARPLLSSNTHRKEMDVSTQCETPLSEKVAASFSWDFRQLNVWLENNNNKKKEAKQNKINEDAEKKIH